MEERSRRGEWRSYYVVQRGRGSRGLYEGPMLYRLLTWHRAKKGEQEEKEEKEDEEVEEEEAEERERASEQVDR